MSIILTIIAYALFAAWVIVSVGAIGMWAWLTILPNTRLRMCRAPAGLSQPVRSGPLRCDSREVLA